MRALWIINDVLPPFLEYVKGKPSTGGSWINPLFFSLSEMEDVQLGVITPVVDGEYFKKEINDITYFSVPIANGDNLQQMKKVLSDYYLKAIDDFKPDIIHIHGVEKNFGLLRKNVSKSIPIICSIQGIINSYEPHLYLSTAGFNYRRFKSLKNWFNLGGIDALKKRWRKYKVLEAEIFKINQNFIGRTLWDKAQTISFNDKAEYYHGEELLREPFYNKDWNIDNCEKYSIFISSGAYPIKGLHILLEAIGILLSKYPGIKLSVPLAELSNEISFKDYILGEDYSNYIRALVKRLRISENVVFLRRLSADDMANYFLNSHVFVLPSFVENSPNSLGEAMMIGTPVITSPAGGVMSIVKDDESALFFPVGDSATLAFQIDRLFSSNQLAIQLSDNAKIIAKKRHDVFQSTIQYKDIYSKVIKKQNESTSHL